VLKSYLKEAHGSDTVKHPWKLLWKLHKGLAQGDMHWYYTLEESKHFFADIRAKFKKKHILEDK
jgi:hypothetical protein